MRNKNTHTHILNRCTGIQSIELIHTHTMYKCAIELETICFTGMEIGVGEEKKKKPQCFGTVAVTISNVRIE